MAVKGIVPYNINGESYRYIFIPRIKDSLWNDFGIIEAVSSNLTDVNKIVYEPNNRKPPRANRFNEALKRYEGGFCSVSKISDLSKDGFSIEQGKNNHPTLSGPAESILYYLLINGIKIGYRRRKPAEGGSNPTDALTATGLVLATTNDIKEIVMGAKFPQAGKLRHNATRQIWACSQKAYDSPPDGWTPVTPPKTTAGDLAQIIG